MTDNPMVREVKVPGVGNVVIRVVSQHPDDKPALELLYAVDVLNDWLVARQERLAGKGDLTGLARALIIAGLPDDMVADKITEAHQTASALMELDATAAVKMAKDIAKASADRDELRRQLLDLVLDIAPSKKAETIAALLKAATAGSQLLNEVLNAAWGWLPKATTTPPDSKPDTKAS